VKGFKKFPKQMGPKSKQKCLTKQRRLRSSLHSIQLEDITSVNIYAPKVATPDFTKQILLDIKVQTDPTQP
jgi:hypothetical protein